MEYRSYYPDVTDVDVGTSDEEEEEEGRKEGGDVLPAKDELLSEMTPRCGSHTGKPVQDPHFGRVILYHTYPALPLFILLLCDCCK